MSEAAQVLTPETRNELTLSIQKDALQKVLSHVQTIVERRNTIPILSNILIMGENNLLRIMATDMDIAIDESLTADISIPGNVTVPAHMLYDIVRKLPNDESIQLSYEDEKARITISNSRSKFTLPCLPVDDFPVISDGKFDHEFDIEAPTLKKLIDGTKFAMSTEETRYYLNGIYFHRFQTLGNDEKLRAVTTDGHRLARVETDLPEKAGQIPGVILPRKTVSELRKLIDSYTGNVCVSVSENRIKFSFDDLILSSKLIDGTFPDYNQVIPKDNQIKIEATVSDFAKAVDRVSTVSNETSRGVKISIEKSKMVLTANSPENGVAREEIAIKYQGETIVIGFNAKYLLDVTQQLSGENLVFHIQDHETPVIVQDLSDENALYVLMPLRV